MNIEFNAVIDELIEAGKRLCTSGLMPGTSGNLSARCHGGITITNSGSITGLLSQEDFSFVDLDGNFSNEVCPSSELQMHLTIYRALPNAGAIAHVHAPFTVALTLAGKCFNDSAIPETKLKFGDVPTTKFAQPSSVETANAVSDVLSHDTKALILPLHGLAAIGRDISDAVSIAQEIEYSAKVQYLAEIMKKVEGAL